MKLVETMYVKKVNPSSLELPEDVYTYDTELFGKINKVAEENSAEIDSLIVNTAKRELHEIKNIEHVILILSLAESFFSDITPYKVSVDEAIELAREYGDEASASFVAGVLGAAYEKKLKN